LKEIEIEPKQEESHKHYNNNNNSGISNIPSEKDDGSKESPKKPPTAFALFK